MAFTRRVRSSIATRRISLFGMIAVEMSPSIYQVGTEAMFGGKRVCKLLLSLELEFIWLLGGFTLVKKMVEWGV